MARARKQDLPVRLARPLGERGGDAQDPGPAAATARGRARGSAGRSRSRARPGRGRSAPHDLVPGHDRLRFLEVLHARQVDVEEVDLAVDRDPRPVGPEEHGRVAHARVAGHALGSVPASRVTCARRARSAIRRTQGPSRSWARARARLRTGERRSSRGGRRMRRRGPPPAPRGSRRWRGCAPRRWWSSSARRPRGRGRSSLGPPASRPPPAGPGAAGTGKRGAPREPRGRDGTRAPPGRGGGLRRTPGPPGARRLVRGPGLPAGPSALAEERAHAAGRLPGVADLAAVEDDEVGRPRPALAGTSAMSCASTSAGSSPWARPRRFVTRSTCVSTAMPSAMSKAWPRTTLAVLRPMPGSGTRAAMLRGTSPRGARRGRARSRSRCAPWPGRSRWSG